MGLGSWGGFLDKLLSVLPIQTRKERWRNEINNLTKEKARLQKGVCNEKKSRRISNIDSRIAYLNQLCRNEE
jgi:hypothetical protein